jgi:hypothetical protein
VKKAAHVSALLEGGGKLTTTDDRIVAQRPLAAPRQRPPRLISGRRELAQIRRRLVLARWHQVAILPDEIGLLLEDDDRVVLMTEVFGPCRVGDGA